MISTSRHSATVDSDERSRASGRAVASRHAGCNQTREHCRLAASAGGPYRIGRRQWTDPRSFQIGGLAPAPGETRLRTALGRRDDLPGVGDSLNRVALLWFVYRSAARRCTCHSSASSRRCHRSVIGPIDRSLSRQAPKAAGAIAVSLARALLESMIHPPARGAPAPIWAALPDRPDPSPPRRDRRRPCPLDRGAASGRPADLAAANALIQGTATLGVLVGPAVAGLWYSLFRNFEGALSRRRELRRLRRVRRAGAYPPKEQPGYRLPWRLRILPMTCARASSFCFAGRPESSP